MKIYLTDLNIFIIISLFSFCSLKSLTILYSLKADDMRPIITNDYLFYSIGYETKALSKNYKIYDMFSNSFRRPLINIGNIVFFSKDCRLEMYVYRGKNTLKQNILFERSFNELNGEDCYSTLDMFYDYKREDIVVYNTNYDKITVFNLKDVDTYGANDNIVGQVKMDHNIMQALIYNYNEETSILIGIDNFNINFYNLRGSYSWKDWVFSSRLIESIKLKIPISYNYGRKIASIMKDRLLYIDDGIYFYDLQNFKLVSAFTMDYPSTVLTLDKGIILIGNKDGLIKEYEYNYNNEILYILETYKVCNGEVLDISYHNTKNDKSDFFFVLCSEKGGHFLKHISLKSKSFIISPSFIIFFFFVYLF